MNLTFDEEKHEYRLDGVRIPSVTGILQALWITPQYPAGPYRVRGRQVHTATELYDAGTIEQYEIGSTIKPYLQSYIRLLETEFFIWDSIELRAYDPELLVAGTMDRAGLYNGSDPCIVDLKSGTTGDETGLQIAAYTRMRFLRNEWKNVRRFKIELQRDGEPAKLTEYKDPADFEGWVGATKLYTWLQRKRHKIAA